MFSTEILSALFPLSLSYVRSVCSIWGSGLMCRVCYCSPIPSVLSARGFHLPAFEVRLVHVSWSRKCEQKWYPSFLGGHLRDDECFTMFLRILSVPESAHAPDSGLDPSVRAKVVTPSGDSQATCNVKDKCTFMVVTF